jgi:hypothetical protein
VLLDNLKLYVNGVGADLEIYDAKTGILQTEPDKARDRSTAYRFSWMNATGQYKVARVYDAKTGIKLTDFTYSDNQLVLPTPYQDVVVDYWFEYSDKSTSLIVGRPLTNGYLSLSGKTRVKDEITGQIKTGIINIPKLKLMSDLSMRLGDNATPIVGTMDAVAVPVGNRGNKKVMEILFLEDDIDSDM